MDSKTKVLRIRKVVELEVEVTVSGELDLFNAEIEMKAELAKVSLPMGARDILFQKTMKIERNWDTDGSLVCVWIISCTTEEEVMS